MKPSTIQEFNLTEADSMQGSHFHHIDHIATNMKLSKNFKILKKEKNKFNLSLYK
jgi:hypothetical protein